MTQDNEVRAVVKVDTTGETHHVSFHVEGDAETHVHIGASLGEGEVALAINDKYSDSPSDALWVSEKGVPALIAKLQRFQEWNAQWKGITGGTR